MILRAVLAFVGLLAAGCSRPSGVARESAEASAAVKASEIAAAPAVDAVGPKPFGERCLGDAECAGGVCFHKRVKEPEAGAETRGDGEALGREGYCSMRCNDDRDCPVPPTKGRCGARGMCKRAE